MTECCLRTKPSPVLELTGLAIWRQQAFLLLSSDDMLPQVFQVVDMRSVSNGVGAPVPEGQKKSVNKK